MNQLGNEGGCTYNCQPYADNTGYAPVNTAYELTDPSRWQPDILSNRNGTFEVQHFITPQLGQTDPFSYNNPNRFHAPFPRASQVQNEALYRAQADEVQHDAVRPFSAIEYLYGDDHVRAWGGPGQGTVHDLAASEWRSYLQTANHPEYPSASASFCTAHAQAARRFLGTDDLNWTIPVAQGSSNVEPGVTPQTDITLDFATWSEFEHDCGLSRLWGGVHFSSSIPAGQAIGHEIGDIAYEYVEDLIAGTN